MGMLQVNVYQHLNKANILILVCSLTVKNKESRQPERSLL